MADSQSDSETDCSLGEETHEESCDVILDDSLSGANDDHEFEQETIAIEDEVVNEIKGCESAVNWLINEDGSNPKVNYEEEDDENSDDSEIISFEDGFKIPKSIWNKLFGYQKTGVRWLWKLHQEGVGGIVGDEMGLGKTIQMIAFLVGLAHTKVSNFRELYDSLGPSIIVCPATVMHQWAAEIKKWWPDFKVSILHRTGNCPKGKEKSLVTRTCNQNGILITSYQCILSYQDHLIDKDWHYIILDEGHKIRNPDALVTLACKRFRTAHRIILSGSPIQNNLKELWSIFDMIYPSKLGTLPVFMEKFAVPITQGGYANANDIQVRVGFKCATVLRDTIKPYLMRRTKEDVKEHLTLPSKNEQVLFCKLTDEQKNLYRQYLQSSEIAEVKKGSRQIFVGLMNLRHICNHPDLFHFYKQAHTEHPMDMHAAGFGHPKRSGKMLVVDSLLKAWREQGHKVLLFSQSVQMIKVLEKYIRKREYPYLMMHGGTPIGNRQNLIKEFNENSNIFIFLLTTRVGGLGVNLTGANRIIIYDPDWNPSVDMQARERAWRIGQNRQVTIYRLLTIGSVEEKMYHRQIFKLYLTNKILKDPKQRRFFKTNDLYELFTLGDDNNDMTESQAVFAGTKSEVKVNHKAKKPKKSKSDKNSEDEDGEINIQLSASRIAACRERAKMISKMIAAKYSNTPNQIPDEPSTSVKASKKITEDKESKKERNERRKEEKGAKVDGIRIKYLKKLSTHKSRDTLDEELSQKQDDYVLKQLFKNTSVKSALHHDIIEGTSVKDYQITEAEAESVAQDAIKALEKSRELCQKAAIGTLTWTGNSGTAGANYFGQGSKKSRTPSKSQGNNAIIPAGDLLSRIRDRNKLQNRAKKRARDDDSEEDELQNGAFASFPRSSDEELLADLRAFIAFQSRKNGEATTNEILERFSDRVGAEKSATLKAMLQKICQFHRRSDKTGVWTLKSNFR